MIITCNKCSTSFNLDDSLVKEDGSKVRCSVCKDIFTAYPLPAESEQVSEEKSDLAFESDPDDGDAFEEPSEFEMDDDLSFEDSELEISEDGESQEIEFEESHLEFEDDGIGFGDSEEDLDEIEFETIEDDEPLNLPSEDSELSLEIDDEKDFQTDIETFDETPEEAALDDESEFELEFDVEDDSEDINEIPLELEPEPDKEDAGLSLEESQIEEEEEPPLITPEEDFSEYDEVLEQETEPIDHLLEEETIETENIQEKEEIPVEKPKPVMDTPPRSRRRKKKPLVGAPVLVMMLIFFLVIGAYIASIMTGYKIPYISDIKIPFIEQYFKKTVPEAAEAKPVPNQKSVNGRFVTNSSAGTLFVITGRVENPSNIAYRHIEIRGALITKGKKEAKIKKAFCGNIITEEMLKTGNISDINKLLIVKAGNHNSNINIKPGASVPFMVVFTDLPDKLQNFTVKVITFEKVKDN